MLIGAIEAQLNIINYELKFTLDNCHFITEVKNMKTISIFQVQDINNLLKQKNYDYTLKLHDACGSQSLFLQYHGSSCDINELCDVINDYLKKDYLKVHPGSINPYNISIK